MQCQGAPRSAAALSDPQSGVPAPQCKALSGPESGYMDCIPTAPGSFQTGSICEFSCREGFVLTGPTRLHCGRTGEWDGEEPACEGTVSVFVFCCDKKEKEENYRRAKGSVTWRILLPPGTHELLTGLLVSSSCAMPRGLGAPERLGELQRRPGWTLHLRGLLRLRLRGRL